MFRDKVRNREKTIGMHINLMDTCAAKIAGTLGFDFVWVDMEHSYLSLEQLQNHLMVLQALGTAAIVRVPQDDLTYTKKVLEMGPDGIIFPMIRSKEEADRLIASTLYPPCGTRGFGPMNATDFGNRDVMQYIEDSRRDLLRFIQIEHLDAVEDLERIMENPWIDGYIFGPCDLSGSIGELNRVYDKNTTALIARAMEKLTAAGKYVGLSTGSTDPAVIRHWSGMGIHMISAGADFGFVLAGAQQAKEALTSMHRDK